MRVLFLSFILTIGGCSTLKVVEPPAEKIGMIPDIGEEATAPVGGVVFTQFKYLAKSAYVVTNGMSIGLALGKIEISPGDSLVEANLNGEQVFCTERQTYVDPIAGPYRTSCFIDADGDEAFETVKAAPGAIWYSKDISPPLPYEKSDQMVARSGSFKYELLYKGRSRDALNLSYREYLDDLARPAFYQDVTYDVESTPTTITFRNVRIEVLDADNNQIVYRVLSGF